MTNRSVLQVKMFGDLTLVREDRSQVFPPASKSAGLLAYLVLHPYQDHPRARLAQLFWSDTNDPRGNLRRAISNLRKAFSSLGSDPEQVLPSSDVFVRLNADAVATE